MAKKQTDRRTISASQQHVNDLNIPSDITSSFPFLIDWKSREWNTIPAGQAYGAYVLGLIIRNDDYRSVHASTSTDGGGDKKIDMIYIDEEIECAYIVQISLYDNWNRVQAQGNKASDLNSAVAWLLSASPEGIPNALKPKIEEVRNGLENGGIRRVELLFVHNCPESADIKSELDAVEAAASRQLPEGAVARTKEFGYRNIQSHFDALSTDILIRQVVKIKTGEQIYLNDGSWKAVQSYITGSELQRLYKEFGQRLFSANIRDYLQTANRKGNINKSILQTVSDEPQNIWPYNNGITILTNNFTATDHGLSLEGISIINGAQTTGVLKDSDSSDARSAKVPLRVISCNDEETVNKIIRYNNTQNAVKSFDLRSNDPIQLRLKREFDAYQINYVHRRSGVGRATQNSIHAETVAQSIASFNGDFGTAIRRRSDIFDDDNKYASIFNIDISSGHVYLIQCLADAIDRYKEELAYRKNDLSARESVRLDILQYSTAKQFMIAVLGYCKEELAGKRLQTGFDWKINADSIRADRRNVVTAWKLVLDVAIPLVCHNISSSPYKSVRSQESAKSAGESLAVHMDSFSEMWAPNLAAIRNLTN